MSVNVRPHVVDRTTVAPGLQSRGRGRYLVRHYPSPWGSFRSCGDRPDPDVLMRSVHPGVVEENADQE